MVKTSKQIMRVALLLMLFQFFAPTFLPIVAQEVANGRETTIHVQHNSIPTPILLKEKDEKELEENSFTSSHIPLLDLTIHSLNLEASHSGKVNYFHSEILYNSHPQLFTFHCTFVI